MNGGIWDRLKDARTWTMLVAIVNGLMVYFNVDTNLVVLVDAAIALIAFLLFGVIQAMVRAVAKAFGRK